jgi:PAS domain S-box-containing protein
MSKIRKKTDASEYITDFGSLSLEQLSLILDATDTPLCLIRISDWTILFANHAVHRVFQYPGGSLAGKRADQHPAWKDQRQLENIKELIASEREIKQYRTWLVSGEGNDRYVSLSVQMVRVAGESCALITATDLTEEYTTRAELRSSQHRFELITGLTTDWVFSLLVTTDKEMKIEWVSGGFSKMTGYPDSVLKSPDALKELFHPEDYERLRNDIETLELGVKVFEYRVRRKSGGYLRIHFEFLATLGPEDGELRLQGSATDVSELRQKEELFSQTRRVYREVVDQSPNPIFMVDREGTIRTWNRASEQQLGYNDEIVGQSFERLFPDKQGTQIASDLLNRAFEGEVIDSFQLSMVDSRQVNKVMLSRVYAVKDPLEDRQLCVFANTDVTNRISVQQALKESEEKYRLIAEYTYDWESWHGGDGRLLWVNPAVERIAGYTPDECLIMDEYPFVLFHDDDVEGARKLYERAQEGIAVNDQTNRIVRKDGGIRWVAVSLNPVRDERGRVTGVRSSFRDFTERKLAQDKIAEAEDRIAALLRGVPDLLFRHSADGTYLDVYAPDESMLAIPRDKIIGRTYKNVGLPPKLVKQVDEAVKKVKKTGELQRFEYELVLDGEIHYWEMLLTPITGDEFYAIIRNIDERVEAESALRNSEELFRSTMNASPVAFALSDPDEKFFAVNPAMVNLFGYTEDELIGMSWADLTHPEDLDRGHDAVEAMLSGKHDSVSFEKRYIHKNGSIIHADLSAVIQRDEQGNPLRFISQIQDMTVRKHAEQELVRAKRFYEIATEAGLVMTHEHDLETDEIVMDPLFFSLLGLPVKRVLDLDEFKRLVHPEDLPGVLDAAQQRVHDSAGSDEGAVYRVIAQDGQIRWFLSRTELKVDEDGKRKALVGSTVDITRTKQYETELRRATDRYHAAVQAGKIGILEWNLQEKSAELDEIASEHFGLGYMRTNLSVDAVLNLIHENDRDMMHERFLQSVHEKATRGSEFRIDGPDGTIRWIRVYTSNEQVKQSPSSRVVAVQNITERKREEQLQAAQLSLMKLPSELTVNEMLRRFLDEVEALTESDIGFYHFLDEHEETISLQAWSTNTLESNCDAEGAGLHYPVSQAGVWVDCVHKRKPVIHNDYASLPHRKGTPEGHVSVERELVVPVVRADRIVAILGVGNKNVPYTDDDVDVVQRLADMAWESVTRKQAEEALRASEERLERTIDALGEGTFDWNLETDEILLNTKALALFGFDADKREATSAELFGKVHPEDRETVQKKLDSHLKQMSELYESEFRVIDPDETVRWIYGRGKVIEYDHRGVARRMVGSHVDVTVRKNAEQSLLEAETRFRAMFDENRSVMLMIDKETARIVDSNAAAESFYGYTHEELCSMKITDINILEDDVVYEKMKEAENKQTNIFHFKHLLADGTTRDVEVYSGPIRTGGRELLYSIIHDITERVQAEKKQREAEERHKLLFQGVSDAVFIHDLKGNILEVNDVACEHLGYSHDELVKMSLRDIDEEETGRLMPERVEELLKQGRLIFEAAHIRKDGHVVPVEIHGHVIEIQGQRLIMSAVRDITERKRADQERLASERLSATATLAGGFAHDINNLMAAVMGNAELALDDTNNERPVSDSLLHSIIQSAQRAGELAHQLLAYSGGGHYNYIALNVNELISSMLQYRRRLLPRNVKLEVELNAEHDVIIADRAQFQLVLTSVLNNAVEAIEVSGRILVRTEGISKEREEIGGDDLFDFIRIRVLDDGCGMNEATIEHVFEPFFSTKFTGRGMGLAAAHGVVKHLHGDIEIVSGEGAGTEVQIDLPLTTNDDEND